jgi:hypothetical protein
VVLLAGYHLGGGLAGAPASCLEHLTMLLGVGETKVHYFDLVAGIQQQILWLEVSVHYV